MAQILSGKLTIEPAFIDLGQVVQDAANVAAAAAAAKGIELKIEIDRHCAVFFGDPTRLQQIVWNLVSNAVKFYGSRNGVGAACAEQARQSDEHRRGRHGDRHQSRVSALCLRPVQSGEDRDPPDRMVVWAWAWRSSSNSLSCTEAQFACTATAMATGRPLPSAFPLRRFATMRIGPRRTEANATLIAEAPQMPGLDGIRVLIVDDDVSAREMAKVVLEHCGASVRSAASAADARNALAQSGYDVLLVDIAMPGEDGYTFIRRMRNDGFQQPAAALTALAHETDRVRALESGFDVHIQKPVEPRALAKAVAALVSTTGWRELKYPRNVSCSSLEGAPRREHELARIEIGGHRCALPSASAKAT